MKQLRQFIFEINRRRWLKKVKKKIQNKEVSIICNNCTAGFIYHDLGLQFKTPTINLFFKTDQFISFVKDLEYYLKCPLVEVKREDITYPIGMLKSSNKKKENIYLYFNHYATFAEAEEKWNERKKRICWNNICFILDFYDSAYDIKLIDEFNKLDIKNKIVLIHNKNIHKKNCFCFQYEEEIVPNGKLFKFDGLSGKRYLDEFDYVDFLNHITK